MKTINELTQQLEEYILHYYGGEAPNPWDGEPDGGHIRVCTALADIMDMIRFVDVMEIGDICRLVNKAFNENGPVAENE